MCDYAADQFGAKNVSRGLRLIALRFFHLNKQEILWTIKLGIKRAKA
jgi:hypothetical protein